MVFSGETIRMKNTVALCVISLYTQYALNSPNIKLLWNLMKKKDDDKEEQEVEEKIKCERKWAERAKKRHE